MSDPAVGSILVGSRSEMRTDSTAVDLVVEDLEGAVSTSATKPASETGIRRKDALDREMQTGEGGSAVSDSHCCPVRNWYENQLRDEILHGSTGLFGAPSNTHHLCNTFGSPNAP